MRSPEHIILSRTDSIGDVMLTLPMAGLIKQRMPGTRITFIGRRYTLPVLRCCAHVDEAIALDDLREGGAEAAVARLRALRADAFVHVFPQRELADWARRAGIAVRVGTSHRWWHWLTCNRRVAFSRRRSTLHEAQLNIRLLEPFGLGEPPPLDALSALSGFDPPAPDETVRALLRPGLRQVILHPLSQGSAVEWGLDRFKELIRLLDPARHRVIVTGTKAEAERYRPMLDGAGAHVTDAGGLLSLQQLIALVGACDALVAASTGPLHIAAACGKRAIGLYSPQPPIHPGRWGPIGPDARALVAPGAGIDGDALAHIRAITPQMVLRELER